MTGVNLLYFCREVSILAQCSDPFLVQFVGFTTVFPYCIVTEYLANGSVFDSLEYCGPSLSPLAKTVIAYGVAQGMASLHRNRIMHRDLKAMNILLDNRLLPKICDFGISRFLGSESAKCTAQVGTPQWMAPEVFGSTTYDLKVDVYAFGMLMWSMLTGSLPFPNMEGIAIGIALLKDRIRPPIPPETPPGLQRLIRECWAQNPRERPTFDIICGILGSGAVYFPGTAPIALAEALAQLPGTKPRIVIPVWGEDSLRRRSHSTLHPAATAIAGQPSSGDIPEMKKRKRSSAELFVDPSTHSLWADDDENADFFNDIQQSLWA
jgi:serine/threonine protein kinase